MGDGRTHSHSASGGGRVALTGPPPGRTRPSRMRAFPWRIAVAAVVIAAGAAAWGLFVSSGWLAGVVRQALVHRLEATLKRPVALGGVGGSPWQGFDIRNLVIAEPGGFSRGVVFSADRIHIEIDPSSLALHPGDVMGSVVRVVLETPRIAIARSASGAWNLTDFSGGGTGSLGPQFRGRIVVVGGIVGYTDGWQSAAAPFATRFSGVSGTIEFRAGRQVAFDLSAVSYTHLTLPTN